MVNAILVDLAPKRGSEAILFVNGFGGTPLIELYLLYHEAARIIDAAGIKPARSLVGSFVTSLDMAGASITVSLLDDVAARLWDAPVHTAALRWGV
jgi:dihydroxyacetone kinase-like protein